MDFGIAVAPSADSRKVVKRAEELGFVSAWFYDSQLLYADLFVAMAAAAVQTSKIRLGTGVLVPFNRAAPVTANALASLNQLAPGRIDFGVGTGFTSRRSMGLPAMRFDDVREYVRVVEALLEEETVEWDFEGRRRKIRFLNPEAGLINLRDLINVHFSAYGPKAIEMTAELSSHWINFGSDMSTALVSLITMQDEWHNVGRDASTCYASLFVAGCVLADGEAYDSDRAVAQAGPQVAARLHVPMDGPPRPLMPGLPEAELASYREVYESYEPSDARYLSLHRGHMMFVRPEEREFITADAVRERTFTGTVEELAERVRTLRNAGYGQVVFQIVQGQEEALDDWARVVAAV
jgi:5,10-methylenetetrahydromethanopterin reductase